MSTTSSRRPPNSTSRGRSRSIPPSTRSTTGRKARERSGRRIYLLDRDGVIRYDHHGEGRYAEIEAAIRALLAEPVT
jgi:hypothetical protein